MFRRSTLVVLPVALGVLTYRNVTFNAEKWPFDTKVRIYAYTFHPILNQFYLQLGFYHSQGFPTSLPSTAVKVPTAANPLILAGVGMRRKNLYITEVDVYLTAINLSSKALKRAQEWSATHKSEVTLSDYLTQDFIGKKVPTDVAVSVTLRFCRHITKDQFLTAFDEVLKGCTPDAVVAFKTKLGGSISSGAVSQKDELVLFWLDNGDIAYTLNGEPGERLTNFELNKRLLEIYMDPAKTVSKELTTCLEKHIGEISS